MIIDFNVFSSVRVLEIVGCKPLQFKNAHRIRKTLKVLKVDDCACLLDFLLIPNTEEEKDSNIEFLEWPNLKEIIAPSNEICILDEHFKYFPALERLNLESNVISKVQNLQNCYQLSHLILKKNCIWGVENIGSSVGNLKYLVLSHNGLFSTKGLEKLFGLEHLDISHNHINEISDIEQLSLLPCLVELVVEGNPVASLDNFRDIIYVKFGNPDLVLDNKAASRSEIKLLESDMKGDHVHLSKAASVSTISKEGTVEIEKKPPSGKWTILEFNNTYEYPEEAKESRGFIKAVPKVPVKSKTISDIKPKKRVKGKAKRVVKIEESAPTAEVKIPQKIVRDDPKLDEISSSSLEKIKKFHEENGSSWLIIYNAYRDREGYVDEEKDPKERIKKDRRYRQTIANMQSLPDNFEDIDFKKPYPTSSSAISISNSDESNENESKDSYGSEIGSFGSRKHLKANRRTIMMSLPISGSSGSLSSSFLNSEFVPSSVGSKNPKDQIESNDDNLIKDPESTSDQENQDDDVVNESPVNNEKIIQKMLKCAMCEHIQIRDHSERCHQCNSNLLIKYDALVEEDNLGMELDGPVEQNVNVELNTSTSPRDEDIAIDELDIYKDNTEIAQESDFGIFSTQETKDSAIEPPNQLPLSVSENNDTPDIVDNDSATETKAELTETILTSDSPVATEVSQTTEAPTVDLPVNTDQLEKNYDDKIETPVTSSHDNDASSEDHSEKVDHHTTFDLTTISLNKKIYFGINILDGSELDKIVAYMPTNSIVFNTNVNKETPSSILLTKDHIYILNKKGPLKSYFDDDGEDNDELFLKIEYEKVKRIVTGPFYQWFRIELANDSYVFLPRCHSKVHKFIRIFDDVVKSRHGFVLICSENEEILNSLDEVISDTVLPQSSALTFSMLDSGRAKVESYTLVTQFSRTSNRQFNMTKKNNFFVIPRTLVITTHEVLIFNEDYAKWPSLMSASWVKPKTPHFSLVYRFSISDIVSLDINDFEFDEDHYIGIEVEKDIPNGMTQLDNNYIVQIATAHLSEKEKIVKTLSTLWKQLFRLDLTCK